ncbi:hypothetical protein T492DRAFT_831850 [Pavlovales sp. CCMP2436]|nr:hypothetical protein T492DRAFT_831850 [Pavlovales sp. CCMP2436]
MEKPPNTPQTSVVTEEIAEITIASMIPAPTQAPVQEPPVLAVQPPVLAVQPPVKVKRAVSEKQRLNYIKANARRLEILAEAKASRVAAASEVKRQQDAITEYELAVKLAAKYGFTPQPPPVYQNHTEESPAKLAKELPPPLRYRTHPLPRPPIRYF